MKTNNINPILQFEKKLLNEGDNTLFYPILIINYVNQVIRMTARYHLSWYLFHKDPPPTEFDKIIKSQLSLLAKFISQFEELSDFLRQPDKSIAVKGAQNVR